MTTDFFNTIDPARTEAGSGSVVRFGPVRSRLAQRTAEGIADWGRNIISGGATGAILEARLNTDLQHRRQLPLCRF